MSGAGRRPSIPVASAVSFTPLVWASWPHMRNAVPVAAGEREPQRTSDSNTDDFLPKMNIVNVPDTVPTTTT